jgi:Spy/CpxP family protein refolding chaperone
MVMTAGGVSPSPEKKVRHLLIGLALIAVGYLSTTAGAQGYRWWQNAVVQRELRLSHDQVETLEALFVSTLDERRALRRELDRREEHVQQLLMRGDTADAQAIEAITQLEIARGRRNAARTLMLFRMYRVLSLEQRQALKRLPPGTTSTPADDKPTPSPR